MFECNRNSYLVQFILFLVGLALISGKSRIFPAFCRWEEAQGRRGCNAHIVRLPQDQQLTDFDPLGVDFLNCLIFSQTNNVCVAPPLLLPDAWHTNCHLNTLYIK